MAQLRHYVAACVVLVVLRVLPGNVRRMTGTGYDREHERSVSAEVLEQARWMFEQDEKRHENAQRMAVSVLTLTGAAAALVPRGLPESPPCLAVVGLLAVLAAALATVFCCVMVLRPRKRENGLPSVKSLRDFAHEHDQQNPVPVPATQFAVDLLNAHRLEQDSPLDVSRRQANDRMQWLGWSYIAFAATFALALVLLVGQSIV